MSLIHLIATLFALFACVHLALAADISALPEFLERRYSRAHSLGQNYVFDSRDGWETVNATDLGYKYRRSEEGHKHVNVHEHGNATLHKRAKKSSSQSKHKASQKTASTEEAKSKSKGTAGISAALNSLKAIGKAEPVTITWYTGHDLDNPSCWPNPTWAPTDASFACALTLEGWTTRPKCFKFLELCSSPKTCVFVRVVDSCAGCAKGSKHVDLTQAAFKQLATLDTGLLQVQMRPASDPEGWLESLWGPKAK